MTKQAIIQKTFKNTIELPYQYLNLITSDKRFKIFYGGRASGKTTNISIAALILARKGNYRILCARGIFGTIKDSMYKTLCDYIEKFNWQDEFKVTERYILNIKTGSQFIFKGLDRNITSIKSMEGIDICWVEEAQAINYTGWEVLLPTIRRPNEKRFVEVSKVVKVLQQEYQKTNDTKITKYIDFLLSLKRKNINFGTIKSLTKIKYHNQQEQQYYFDIISKIFAPQIWMSFNPHKESDAVYQLFVANPRENSIVVKVNYQDNPFLDKTLKEQIEYDKKTNYQKYLHVWCGEFEKNNEAQVFVVNGIKKYSSYAFDSPNNDADETELQSFLKDKYKQKFFFGADWGMANDPTAIVRCFIKDNVLYIDYCAGATGILMHNLSGFLIANIPYVKYGKIYCDANPANYAVELQARGFNIEPASKKAGSIIEGISYLLSFDKIVIHPRCTKVLSEFDNYCYNVDKKSGEVVSGNPREGNDHFIDALRYALEKEVYAKSNSFAMVHSKLSKIFD